MTERSLSAGFKVGNWTDPEAATGCTVILAPSGTVGSYDIRGSSPSTREIAHLHPDTKLQEIHAIVLSGGSAYGLAASDGVVAWLEERGIGYSTPSSVVPIVASAVIYDLASGRSDVRPGPAEGRAACDAASTEIEIGRVGGGTGATVGKWGGLEFSAPGGLGWGRAEDGGLDVRAIAVVNAVGDVLDDNGEVLVGTSAPAPSMRRFPSLPAGGTVLAAITTNTPLGKRACRWLAARGSDGITVSVRPAHTRYDGDVVFALAPLNPSEQGPEANDLDVLGHLATLAVARAVRSAVSS